MAIRKLFFLLLLNIISFHCFSQNIEFVENNFRGKSGEFHQAIKDIENGDLFFYDAKEGSDQKALTLYLNAWKFNPSNALLNYKIGACFLNSNTKYLAIKYFRFARDEDPHVNPDLNYFMGKAYHIIMKFDSAIYCYNEFKKKGLKEFTSSLSSEEKVGFLEELDLQINYCQNAILLIDKPIKVNIENLGPEINSHFPEYNPKISSDGNLLAFTSRRDSTTGGNISEVDAKYYEDIYISKLRNGKWCKPINLGKPVNTELNDGIISVSPDGQGVLLDYGSISGDIYEARLFGKRWSTPKKLPFPVNTEFVESSASWSFDGKRLYFTSDRPGGFGGSDIYYCEHRTDGSFSEAINLGPVVNSSLDEESVFLHPDGKTLFFSSKGHFSMGGYDIFRTEFKDGSWSHPENVGYPLNTPDDDVFFSISPDGKTAYFSSERPEGYGGQDLYAAHFQEIGLKQEIGQKNSIAVHAFKQLKGRVLDGATYEPVLAKIEVTDNKTGMNILTITTNSSTGDYLFSLPAGGDYGINYSSPEYLFYSRNIFIPLNDSISSNFNNVLLNKIAFKPKPELLVRDLLSRNSLEIQKTEALKSNIDLVSGDIAPQKVSQIKKEVQSAILQNKSKLIQLFDAGAGIEDVINLVCFEITRKISNDPTEGLPMNCGLCQMVKDELEIFKREVDQNTTEIYQTEPYKLVNGKFLIELLQITKDGINDTTGEIEVPFKLEALVKKNFLDIVSKNKMTITDLLASGWKSSGVRDALAKEIALAGGAKNSKGNAVVSLGMESHVREALAHVFPSIEEHLTFDISIDPSIKHFINKRNGQISPGKEAIINKSIDELILTRDSVVRTLLSGGIDMDEIRNQFNNDLAAVLELKNEDQSYFLPPSLSKTTQIKFDQLLNLYIGESYLKTSDLQIQNNGSINFDVNKIRAMIREGISYRQLCQIMVVSLKEANSNMDDLALMNVVKTFIRNNLPLILAQNKLFNIQLYESTKEAIDDQTGNFPQPMKALIMANLLKVVNDNQLALQLLISNGKTITDITQLLAKAIAFEGGAIDENGQAIANNQLLELVNSCLKLKINPTRQDNSFNNKVLKPIENVDLWIKTGYSYQDVCRQILAGSQIGDHKQLSPKVDNLMEDYFEEYLLKPLIYQPRIVLSNIFFDYNQASLRNESETELFKLLKIMKDYPEIQVEVSGHTDNIGSDNYNNDLSLRRAKSVTAWLVEKGIPAKRLTPRGYGKSQPLSPNVQPDGSDYPEGRQINRRTEFKIID